MSSTKSLGLIAALAGVCALQPSLALAQKSGGTLRSYEVANPPSASILEEATSGTTHPFMAVFNNLVIFDQAEPVNKPEVIRPELAESWAWDAAQTKLTFKLRQGVTWHDGKPFTAKDVKCTWDWSREADPKSGFRKNPRKLWWDNIKEITVNGDHEVTFELNRPQASLLTLMASGMSPVYPCHVPARIMRTKPIGTGPFRVVAFEANKFVRLEKNPNYWRKDRPYLDGLEFQIMGSRGTRLLAFAAGEIDLTFVSDVTRPLLPDVKSRSPNATCEFAATGVSANLLVNRDKPPFDNPKLREAMMLTLDRDAMVKIVSGGEALIGGAMLPPPAGVWSNSVEEFMKLPSYAGTIEERRQKARKIMEELGYGPNNKLKIKVGTRDYQSYKDPAVLLVDHLNQINFDAELEIIETSLYYGRITRGDYQVALNLTGTGVDDPDVTMFEGYLCGSSRNYTNYCNKEVDRLIHAQSAELDTAKRKELVWQIEKILAEDVARPIIFQNRSASCWHPHVKGYVLHQNSIYNSWRFEDVWLDK
ncbi:ABC transporter substrate-binding protein [Hyphomicrobium sp. CS1BSMeth3]|uniref:ABC transporter substrate-binding protein n=1 Tax=Hyphomicrobium sp. CS1BSMeth3 TaxID=1892844 RepID=UPI0009309FE4|nr:ABC transporter substrate-binding protein [Hyphomicrobium sp. CS1BSMeth3]